MAPWNEAERGNTINRAPHSTELVVLKITVFSTYLNFLIFLQQISITWVATFHFLQQAEPTEVTWANRGQRLAKEDLEPRARGGAGPPAHRSRGPGTFAHERAVDVLTVLLVAAGRRLCRTLVHIWNTAVQL